MFRHFKPTSWSNGSFSFAPPTNQFATWKAVSLRRPMVWRLCPVARSLKCFECNPAATIRLLIVLNTKDGRFVSYLLGKCKTQVLLLHAFSQFPVKVTIYLVQTAFIWFHLSLSEAVNQKPTFILMDAYTSQQRTCLFFLVVLLFFSQERNSQMSAWMWRRRQVWRCRIPTEQTLLLCNPLLPWVSPDFWTESHYHMKQNGQIMIWRGVRCVGRKWTEAADGGTGQITIPNSSWWAWSQSAASFLDKKKEKSPPTAPPHCWRRRFWHMLANDDDWRDCGCFLWKAAACVETKYTWQPTCLQSEFESPI